MADIQNDHPVIAAAILPFVVPLMYVVLFPILLFNAWAAYLMYGWFIQPLGAPELSFWHVVGLWLTFHFVLKGFKANDDSEKNINKTVLSAFMRLLVTGMVILTGLIIHGWI